MLIKILIGIVAGIISGLFSTGGGMILVPAFIYFLKIDQRKSRATSIMCILFMVIATTIFYFKNNYINFELGLQCAVGGTIGGFIGAKFLNKLPEYVLKMTCLYVAGRYANYRNHSGSPLAHRKIC